MNQLVTLMRVAVVLKVTAIVGSAVAGMHQKMSAASLLATCHHYFVAKHLVANYLVANYLVANYLVANHRLFERSVRCQCSATSEL